MKKVLSVVLSIIFIFTMLPLSAIASENNAIQDELLAKACAVFPEYSNKIQYNTFNPNRRSARSNELIVTMVRSVSENEYLIYSEYSDGMVLLTNYEAYPYEIVSSSSTTSDIVTNYTVTIKATVPNVSGYYMISGFKYSIISGQYDAILDDGTASWSGSFYGPSDAVSGSIRNETASSAAKVEYRPLYSVSGSTYQTSLLMTVRNNVFSISHTRRD